MSQLKNDAEYDGFIDDEEWVHAIFRLESFRPKNQAEAKFYCGRVFNFVFFDVGQGLCFPINPGRDEEDGTS